MSIFAAVVRSVNPKLALIHIYTGSSEIREVKRWPWTVHAIAHQFVASVSKQRSVSYSTLSPSGNVVTKNSAIPFGRGLKDACRVHGVPKKGCRKLECASTRFAMLRLGAVHETAARLLCGASNRTSSFEEAKRFRHLVGSSCACHTRAFLWLSADHSHGQLSVRHVPARGTVHGFFH